MSEHEVGEAYFDAGRVYRYALSRVWEPKKPMMMFIGLNPSTADETKLDPTLRRVIGYAKREGCGGLWMANAFAFRATEPKDMKNAADPVGPMNDRWLLDIACWCPLIVVGWGTHGAWLNRDAKVRTLLQGYELKCLKTTKTGMPGHPLYLKSDAPLQTFQDRLWRPGA